MTFKIEELFRKKFGQWKERFPILTYIPRYYPFFPFKLSYTTFIMNLGNSNLYQRHHQETMNQDKVDDEDDVLMGI